MFSLLLPSINSLSCNIVNSKRKKSPSGISGEGGGGRGRGRMATLLENVTLSFSFFLAFSFIMKIKSLNKEFFPLRINHMLEGLQTGCHKKLFPW